MPSVAPTSSKTPTAFPTSIPSLSPSYSFPPSISLSPSCGGSLMMIQIQYDVYPHETSYELWKLPPSTSFKLRKLVSSEETQKTLLASHKGSTGDAYKTHEESICLGDGLYSFSFYDSFGDGFGGRYSLTLVTGRQSSNGAMK